MLMISSTFLILFAQAFHISEAPAEGPTPGSDNNGILPFTRKHVIIRNFVANRQTLNTHCKSSETDYGLIHIPWGDSWGFNFRVNLWKSTKFVCHFTWTGGGSHYFEIFKVSRDDSPLGNIPECDKCIWEVGRPGPLPMCRYTFVVDIPSPWCFPWGDNF